MPLYDNIGNPLTTDQAVATLVDDGSLPNSLYNEAISRSISNLVTAMAAASPAVPLSSGSLALTLSAWQLFCQWAARPYDSFDTLEPIGVARQVMQELESWGGGSPTGQDVIFLHLVWNMRNMRIRNGLANPNPIILPSTWGAGFPWVSSGTTSFSSVAAPNGFGTRITCASNSLVTQPAVPLGRAIAGVPYTFHVWLKSAAKATIGLFLGANSGSGDDTYQSETLTTGWHEHAISKTFTASGTKINLGIDNRVAHGGDGLSGDVDVWNAYVTCEA